MVTGREDLLGALAEAYAMEKGLKAFYDFAADEADSEEVRDVFLRLRDWEERHMEYVAYLHEALTGDLNVNTFEDFEKKMPGTHIEGGVTRQEAAELYEPEECRSDRDAVRIALRIEGRAYTFYRQWAEKAGDPNTRIVFQDMVEQEQKHVALLKDLERRLPGD